jgi:hypothetical protein
VRSESTMTECESEDGTESYNIPLPFRIWYQVLCLRNEDQIERQNAIQPTNTPGQLLALYSSSQPSPLLLSQCSSNRCIVNNRAFFSTIRIRTLVQPSKTSTLDPASHQSKVPRLRDESREVDMLQFSVSFGIYFFSIFSTKSIIVLFKLEFH